MGITASYCPTSCLSRETGKPVTDGWRSVVVSQYRPFFSTLFVRSKAACLTTRMGHLGQESRDRADRRDMLEQETRSRMEAEAHFSAYRRDQGRWGGR